jgi:ABC-type branched-subunit amino acid transport system substrate-binding protein
MRTRAGTRWGRATVALVVVASAGVACGGDDDDESAVGTEPATQTEESAPEQIKTDFGADETTIRIGLLADLSGPFAALVKDIVVAQEAYWKRVNEAGGIGGRRIQTVVVDQKYDVPTHKAKFQAMKARDGKGVLLISQSTGSPHTAAIKTELDEASMIAIPLSYYSGWADPAFGKNVFESYANYCFQAMNSVHHLHDALGAKTLAVATFPGEFGQDAATGAKLAAEALGMDIVYDGEGKVVAPSPTSPNPDHTGIVSSIVASGADLVWTTVNPATLAGLMSQAGAKGFDGKWVGSFGTFHESLLKADVGPLIDSSYYHSTFTAALGTDVPGMQTMVDAIAAYKPDARSSDTYIIGWTEAQTSDAILRAAAARGDLTRAGVVKAAFALDKVDFEGLAPEQTWKGEPDDYVVRASYVFKPKVALYKESLITDGQTGTELVKGPFASDTAKAYRFATQGPCYKAAG